MTVNKTFKKLDTMIADSLPKSDTLFTYSKTCLYGVDVLPKISYTKVTEEADVYEMLEAKQMKAIVSAFDGFAVLTAGWAAPITDDDDGDEIAPSQHPERIRVRLLCYCDTEGMMHSSIRFGDGREVVYDSGKARGSLAEAMHELWKKATKFKKTLALPEEQ